MTKTKSTISIQQKMKTYLDLKKGLVFSNSPLRKSALPSSSILGGAFLTALPMVQISAAIVVTNVNQTITNASKTNNTTAYGLFPIDIDDDGNIEFSLMVYTTYIDFRNLAAGISFSATQTGTGTKCYPLKLISNATIQSPMFKAPTGTLTTNSGADGEWINDSSTGYVGFRFKIGVNNHYGWIELEVTDASSGANMVLIKSWAYNDVADQGLLAGTTIALPVEFVSFDALLINESTHLKWQTASETNNAGFEIERSEDGKNYRSIAWVDGHGTSLEPQEYLFDDKNLRTGRTYYYRLKQVDYDGRFEYSDVVSVSLRSGQDAVGDFFPNPVSTGIASVEINSKEGGEWTADIFDTSGKAIRTEKRFLEVGSAIFRMDMTGLPQGQYFVKFENRGERYYRKLVVE